MSVVCGGVLWWKGLFWFSFAFDAHDFLYFGVASSNSKTTRCHVFLLATVFFLSHVTQWMYMTLFERNALPVVQLIRPYCNSISSPSAYVRRAFPALERRSLTTHPPHALLGSKSWAISLLSFSGAFRHFFFVDPTSISFADYLGVRSIWVPLKGFNTVVSY